MYKNILIPVVFGEGRDTQGSLLAAQALADEGAAFTILHVVEDMPGYVATYIPEDVVERSRAEITERLSEVARGLPNAKAVVGRGHAGRAIAEHAKEHAIDCIVVASHRPGLQDIFIGSTADWVVRHAACSVHVVR